MIGKMKAKKDINQKVESTLESLHGIQRAQANAFLFTRIKARLEQEEKSFWSMAFDFLGKPAIAVAAILLVILLNASIILKSGPKPAQVGQDAEQIFASEYNLADTTIYDSTIDPE
jgi:hypothetical protein